MNDFFSISIPTGGWTKTQCLQMADAILFLLLAIPVVYLLIYALASLGKYKNPYPPAAKQHKFLVLFAVLRNGKEVIESLTIFWIRNFTHEINMT